MADKKIIAVLGSTGSQGSGLVSAILADPNGGFAVRAITRDPGKDKAKAMAAKGARSRQGRSRRRREPEEGVRRRVRRVRRHQLLGALLRREGNQPQAQEHRRGRQGRRREARHLVDARGHAQADEARRQADADAAGQVPVPHFDAKAEANAYFAGAADDVLHGVVLLGQPVPVRPGAEEERQGRLQLGVPDGRREDGRASPRTTSARSPTAIFKAGPQYIGKTVGDRRRARLVRGHERQAREGHGRQPGAVRGARREPVPQLRFPGRG